MTVFEKTMLVGGGGFAGSAARYWVGLAVQKLLPSSFPWHTFGINVIGSITMGLVMGLFFRPSANEAWRLLVAVGFLGGFTTFPTFPYEAVGLFLDGKAGLALVYTVLSALLCVSGAYLGLSISLPQG